LYYRLNVFRIKVPPLRERKTDIIPLAKHFVEEFSKKFKKPVKALSPRAKKALLTYDWKGNVRELRNVMERTVMLNEGEFIDTDFPELGICNAFSAEDLVINLSANGIGLEEVNKLLIEKALIISNDNVLKAAKLLGLKRGAFRYRLRKYQITVPVRKSVGNP
jgi:two-component system, NtrC family, response regulator AtoC